MILLAPDAVLDVQRVRHFLDERNPRSREACTRDHPARVRASPSLSRPRHANERCRHPPNCRALRRLRLHRALQAPVRYRRHSCHASLARARGAAIDRSKQGAHALRTFKNCASATRGPAADEPARRYKSPCERRADDQPCIRPHAVAVVQRGEHQGRDRIEMRRPVERTPVVEILFVVAVAKPSFVSAARRDDLKAHALPPVSSPD